MIIDNNIISQVKEPETLTTPETKIAFNWRNFWYPVTFVQDLPPNRPYGFSIYNEPFVLFRNQEGKLTCLMDICPHRTAKLSDGQIIDGKIECLYHGWQFGSKGECLHIPQLPEKAKIPANSCIQSFLVVERQSMVWVWPGETTLAEENKIPIIPHLDKPEFVSTDFMCTLPYNQQYLIENFADPAHVDISHDGSDGNRNNAQPLEMEILETSLAGFKGQWKATRTPRKFYRLLDFIAPNLVHYQIKITETNLFGLALYSLPLNSHNTAVFVRRYRNFATDKIKRKPRWLEHLRQNRILEEDLPLILGQQAEIERLQQSLKDLYLPLKTSDTFLIEYRKWLDQIGEYLPFYKGYETSKTTLINGEYNYPPALDRHSRHIKYCSSCNQAYQTTIKLKQILLGIAVIMAGVGILTDEFYLKILAVTGIFLAAAGAAGLEKLKTHFERPYTRPLPKIKP